MQVRFNGSSQVQKSPLSTRKLINSKVQSAKSFSYSKRNLTTLNFQQMYKSLQQNVTNLVYQNRVKLTSMNINKSQALINKTQHKLLKYMKTNQQKQRICSMIQNNKQNYKNNNQPAKQFNFQTQQIFDFAKMKQIIQNRNRNSHFKENQTFSGVLCDKMIKFSNHKNYNISKIASNAPQISKIQLTNVPQIKAIPIIASQLNDQYNLEVNGNLTARNYMSWTSQKIKRKRKNILC